MEDVLDVYVRPEDPERPVVCMDESPRQLIGEVVAPLPAESGKPERFDTAYLRNGTCNLRSCLDLSISYIPADA